MRIVVMNACCEAASEFLIEKSRALHPTFDRVATLLENQSAELVAKNAWLRGFQEIGGDNSILHTHCILQSVTHSFKTGCEGLEPTPDRIGPSWNETEGMAKSSSDPCMDELIWRQIMPELVSISHRNAQYLPTDDFSRAFPVLRCLRDWTEGGDRPVPLSVTAGFHALVLGIFHLQGEGDVENIARVSKMVYDNFNAKVKAQVQTDAHYMKDALNRAVAVNELIVKPTLDTVPPNTVLRALWNPLLAGCNILYLALVGSLRNGAHTVDNYFQARICAHLHHALAERDLIKPSLVFDAIFDLMQTSKLVWPTSDKPKQGSFTKTFMLAMGDTLTTASKMVDVIKLDRQVMGESLAKELAEHDDWVRQDVESMQLRLIHSIRGIHKQRKSASTTAIDPTALCRVYKYIFDRSFDDVSYDVGDGDLDVMLSNLIDHARQVTAVAAAMHSDKRVLGVNWPLVGGSLNALVDDVVDSLGWSSAIDYYVKESGVYTPEAIGNLAAKREVAVLLMAQKIFGELDFETEGTKLQTSTIVAELLARHAQMLEAESEGILWQWLEGPSS